MKLKKVVSLALAGVMAVSMLAACGTKPAEDPTEDENSNATATGYSAEFSKYLSEDITDLDYVTFQDSAVDVAALNSAVGYLDDFNVMMMGATPTFVRAGEISADFADKAELTEDYGLNQVFSTQKDIDKTLKLGTLYVCDGTVEVEKALKQVADKVNERISSVTVGKALPESGKFVGSNGTITYNYSYVVSVSVVNRATTTYDQVHSSMNIIAVTITRNSTPV